MADLYASSRKPISQYKDRRYSGDVEGREESLKRSTTLYIGNLSFYTREEQIFDLFSRVGEVKRIIMGLDRIKKTPCGFCFVEYFTRRDAESSVHFLSGTKLDERTIRVDYDIGYQTGRQYGRGRSGGQVRDEHRADFDPGRGGYGKALAQQTGMGGMELWSSGTPGPPSGPPTGPPPIHSGFGSMRFSGPGSGPRSNGRRGRGRGFRGGRGPGPRHSERGYDEGYDSFGPPCGMKRQRDYQDGDRYNGPRDGGYPAVPKRSRSEPGLRGHSNGMAEYRGPGMGDGRPDMDAGQHEGPNGGEPIRNARFERGKKADAE